MNQSKTITGRPQFGGRVKHKKGGDMKKYRLLGAIAMLSMQLTVSTTRAQDANTIEIIKQLQKRIEELEQKVKVLEADDKGRVRLSMKAVEPKGETAKQS